MNPKTILLIVGLAALGAALAIVAQHEEGPEPPPPIDPAPFQLALAAGSGSAAAEGSAIADAEGSAVPVVTNQRSRAIPERVDTPPAEGTGLPEREGPSVGVDPTRVGEPIALLNPVELRAPVEAPPAPGEGTGDSNNPFGENDFPAGSVSREEQFASHMQQQYVELTERIQRCVRDLPASTRDTVHVEMVVRETVPGTTAGVIETFQSPALSGESATCARQSFETIDLPLPWLATAVEAPGFTVIADTAVEYSLEIEIEVGAE